MLLYEYAFKTYRTVVSLFFKEWIRPITKKRLDGLDTNISKKIDPIKDNLATYIVYSSWCKKHKSGIHGIISSQRPVLIFGDVETSFIKGRVSMITNKEFKIAYMSSVATYTAIEVEENADPTLVQWENVKEQVIDVIEKGVGKKGKSFKIWSRSEMDGRGIHV